MARRLLSGTVGIGVGAGIIATLAVALLQPRGPSARAESPEPAPCVRQLMQDWRDGRIDAPYPLPCYQQALDRLPADVRMYSSAEDDIRQARADRIARTSN